MKKSAIFINGSRGETIVEEDLISALLNQEIKGAALDVYKNEQCNYNSAYGSFNCRNNFENVRTCCKKYD